MTDDTPIPPSKQALREALSLSDEILRNIELSELPLANIALKCSRLARLLNDFLFQKIMEYEASGYPTTPNGVPSDVYALAKLAGREYSQKDSKTEKVNYYAYLNLIEDLEQEASSEEIALASARDPDVSISSANPAQFVHSPTNAWERKKIREDASRARKRLSSRRSLIYAYALKKSHELRFSGIADDIFSRIRERVDAGIGEKVPQAVQKLAAVYGNLQSENPEDWSNAVHSCRRLLQDLADELFPPTEDLVIASDSKKRTVKLGRENYINRLVAFLEEHSDSGRYIEVVGSHLRFMGDRLDAIFKAAQKGSHANILSQQEADRYVVYTYLIVGDILSLLSNESKEF